jgi:membrane protein
MTYRVTLRAAWTLLNEAATKWSADRAPRLGAALAYYTLFSLVPLLVIVIAIAGFAFGQQAAQGYIIEQLGSLVGERSAKTIQDMVENARQPTTGALATIVAVGTLLLGASGVFGQLQDALNTIWEVKAKPGRGFIGLIRDRFLSFVAVLGTGFLLLVSLVLSAALAAVGTAMSGLLPAPEFVLQTMAFMVSLAVITVMFAMIFKYLPDVTIEWSDVWIGATVTALLFTVGKVAIGLYLGKSHVASVYGAAGSLVILLVWVYYSGQILLFGAEFTAVYANRYGSRIRPTADAVPATAAERATQGLAPESRVAGR